MGLSAGAEEFLHSHADVIGDLTKQRRRDLTSLVDRNCGAASARITKLQMGAALTNHIEAQFPKDVSHLRRLEDGG
jgi:hypothetical protein